MSMEPVNHAIDALKGNPGMLGVILVSVAFATMTYLVIQADRERHTSETIALIQRCFPLYEEEKQ